MATHVTMADGTESPLVDHIRDAHQKGTRGFTEEYLARLHRMLHQRNREPDLQPEHAHPEPVGADDGGEQEEPRA